MTIRVLAAAATCAMLAGGASAQTLVPATLPGSSAVLDGMFRASDIAESDVYALSRAGGVTWDDDTVYAGVDPDWENLGEIEDVVLDAAGQMVGVLTEVGGFLGMGQRQVLLPAQDLRAVRYEDQIVYVTRLSEEQLEQLPEMNDDYWGRD